MHETLVHWLTAYGYAVVFVLIALESVGIPLPGETALLTASALAAQGRLRIALVIATASLAAIIGDNVGYWIGRRGGPALVARFGRVLRVDQHAMDRVRTFFAEHGAKTVFLGRFVALVRTWTALVAGAAQMPYGSFTAYNALGGVVWSICFGSIGYVFGRNLPLVERYVGRTGLVLIAVAVLLTGGAVWARRRQSNQPPAKP
jgi:membrane protein DedA with SNARE-associated domain